MAQLNLKDYLAQFNKFSKAEQLAIAKKINQKTFESLWLALDADMPDVEMSEEEIMNEVKAVRYANRKKLEKIRTINKPTYNNEKKTRNTAANSGLR